MDGLYDYKKFRILYVDDEEKSLKYFARAFEDQFTILTATNAQDGLRIIEEYKDDIGLLITDQRMPGEKGVWLLEKTRQVQPRIIRMLATAYSDMDAAIAAVNSGSIYKYVTKPWDPAQLEHVLKRGLEFFIVQRERDQLLREKLSVLQNMVIADHILRLGLLAAGFSHHIRNALVAVKTFLDLTPAKLQEEKIDPEHLRNPDFWREYYQSVQGQIEKINSMLRDLWSVSEKPSFEFGDQICFQELAPAIVEKLKNDLAAKEIAVHCQIPADLPAVSGDKPKIERLLELLLRDELVSLPPGSAIDLLVTHGGSNVEIEIRDNGPGLPKELLRLLFDPFTVRADTPLEYGINLMICYFIVYHHGGKIEARSENGDGTAFIVKLPLNPEKTTAPADEQEFLEKVLQTEALLQELLTSS